MPLFLQHLLVLGLVLACAAYAARHAVRALFGKPSPLGSCCSKGCSQSAPGAKPAERIVFIPSESLRRKR